MASRFQGEDSDQTELHPEMKQLEITAVAPHPLSIYQQAAKPAVVAYPLESTEAASESCGMTALF